MDLNFEQMLTNLAESKGFDPYKIAKEWPKNPILGNASSAFIARRLHDLEHEITLERIELIKICLDAVKNS